MGEWLGPQIQEIFIGGLGMGVFTIFIFSFSVLGEGLGVFIYLARRYGLSSQAFTVGPVIGPNKEKGKSFSSSWGCV